MENLLVTNFSADNFNMIEDEMMNISAKRAAKKEARKEKKAVKKEARAEKKEKKKELKAEVKAGTITRKEKRQGMHEARQEKRTEVKGARQMFKNEKKIIRHGGAPVVASTSTNVSPPAGGDGSTGESYGGRVGATSFTPVPVPVPVPMMASSEPLGDMGAPPAGGGAPPSSGGGGGGSSPDSGTPATDDAKADTGATSGGIMDDVKAHALVYGASTVAVGGIGYFVGEHFKKNIIGAIGGAVAGFGLAWLYLNKFSGASSDSSSAAPADSSAAAADSAAPADDGTGADGVKYRSGARCVRGIVYVQVPSSSGDRVWKSNGDKC